MKTRLSIIATLFAFLALSASAARAAVPTASDYSNLASQINALSASYSNLVVGQLAIPASDLEAASAALSGAATTILGMQYRTPAFTYEDIENSLSAGAGQQIVNLLVQSGGVQPPNASASSHFLAISAAYLAARAIVVVYAAAQTPAPVSATPQAAPEQSYEVEVVPIPNAPEQSYEVVPIPNATTPATVVPLARTAIRSNQ